MAEAVELVQHAFVAAHQGVVAQHGGNGHGQAQGGHDECFPNRAGHFVDGGLAGGADAQQRVVNAPDGAEQPHERGGGTHRGQHRQAALQPGGEFVNAVAQLAGDPVAHVQLVVQLGAGGGVAGDIAPGRGVVLAQDVAGGFAAGFGQLAEGVVGFGAQLAQTVFKVGGVPKGFGAFGLGAVGAQVEQFDQDDQPAGQRHAQQNDRHRAGDPVAL